MSETAETLRDRLLAAALLYWLNDKSENNTATWGFIDRRLDDVLKLGRVPAELRRLAERLPNPLRVLKGRRA